MPRMFGSLLEDGEQTDTSLPVCDEPGCGKPAGHRRRANPLSKDQGPEGREYAEAYCSEHVPASWLPGRAS